MDENNNYSNNTPLTLTRNENVNSHSFNPPANTGEIKEEHVNQISSDFLGNNPNLDNTNNATLFSNNEQKTGTEVPVNNSQIQNNNFLIKFNKLNFSSSNFHE